MVNMSKRKKFSWKSNDLYALYNKSGKIVLRANCGIEKQTLLPAKDPMERLSSISSVMLKLSSLLAELTRKNQPIKYQWQTRRNVYSIKMCLNVEHTSKES